MLSASAESVLVGSRWGLGCSAAVEGGVDACHDALACGFFVAGGAIDLAREE